MSRTITIAAAQYDLSAFADMTEYAAKIGKWVEEAANNGADLLVFPEYGAMELCSIGERGLDLQDSIDSVSERIAEMNDIHRTLAMKHFVTIVGGSAPQRRGDTTCNVAHVFGPGGAIGSYDKIMPTPWERQPWGVSGGRKLTVFDIGKARIGVVICYDIEFPLLARALAEAGAEIIVAPSNTETLWGYWRVRTGAMARALENQIITVHSPVVGPAPFCMACENNTGAAGIFAPSDEGFPAGGILALGDMNVPQWVYAKVDLDQLARLRTSGGVRTFAHWAEQPGAGPLPAAEVVDMTGPGLEN